MHNKLFFLFFVVSILIIILFSNIIYKINYINVPDNLKLLIKEELDINKITRYSFKKSYQNLQKIKSNIKNKHSDLIEWIEIEESGITYNIRVIERIKNKKEKDKEPCDIVAKKDGFIMSILSSSGEVLKNPGDYVHKGDVIVSGIIKNNDNIVDIKAADANVYAETWYKVTIRHPFLYFKETISSKYKSFYYFSLLGKRINLYRKKDGFKLINESPIIDNSIFKLVKENKSLIKKEEVNYEPEELEKIIDSLANEKMKGKIDDDAEILLQKTLKKKIEDDKMYVEIFFKVKENIKEERKIDLKRE